MEDADVEIPTSNHLFLMSTIKSGILGNKQVAFDSVGDHQAIQVRFHELNHMTPESKPWYTLVLILYNIRLTA